MKKLLLLQLFILTIFQGFSQSEGISYQAVILNPQEQEIPGENVQANILVNTTIAIQFTILDSFGNEEFQENHTTSTDGYGMINLLIGSGNITSFNSFSDIIWNGAIKKLKVEIDFSGGSNYVDLSEQNLTYMPQPIGKESLELITETQESIISEQLRAEASEKANRDLITSEISRATTAEENLTTSISIISTGVDDERLRAEASEKANRDLITSEISRATTAEENLTTSISIISTEIEDERLRAEASEKANKDLINSETNRATIAEENLNNSILTVSKDLEDEKSRAIEVEGNIQSELDVTQAGVGVAADGTYIKNATANYISSATSLNNATNQLDEQIKENELEINAINDLASGKIYLGDQNGVSQEVSLSGDVTIDNLGSSTISNAAVTAEKIDNDAIITNKIKDENVTYSKIQNVTSGKILGRTSAQAGVVEEISTTGTGNVALSISPTFTGTPTLPTGTVAVTQIKDNNSTAVATTAYADNQTEIEKLRAKGIEGNIQSELDVTQAGVGLATSGTYIQNTNANYISSATSLNNATNKLDDQIKVNETKINTINALASGKIYLGDQNGVSQEVSLSGDVTIDNLGSSTISNNAIITNKIKDENVTYSKIQNVTSGKILGRTSAQAGVVEEISTTGTGNVALSISPTFTGTPNLPTGTVAVTQIKDNNSTAVATTAYVDNQITVSTAKNVSGVVAIANGGTGKNSKTAAFDALSPLTSQGDILYGGASGTGMRLAKGTAKQVLAVNAAATGLEWVTPASTSSITDTDKNTKVLVEKNNNENKIRFDVNGSEAAIIDSDGNLGIGTSSPNEKLHISSEDSDLDLTTYGSDVSTIHFEKASGTKSSPSVLSSSSRLGFIEFKSWDGSDFGASAGIYGYTDGSQSSENTPGSLRFGTTPVGSDSYERRMEIKSNGDVHIYEDLYLYGQIYTYSVKNNSQVSTLQSTVSSTENYVDISSEQTIVGNKTFSGTTNVASINASSNITANGTGSFGRVVLDNKNVNLINSTNIYDVSDKGILFLTSNNDTNAINYLTGGIKGQIVYLINTSEDKSISLKANVGASNLQPFKIPNGNNSFTIISGQSIVVIFDGNYWRIVG